MHNLIKKFFGLCLLVGLSTVTVALPASAQSVSNPNPAYLTSISAVTLSKNAYTQGDTINGSFSLANAGTQNASDLYYRISLVGQYDKNLIPQAIYDRSDLQGPVSVAGAKTSVINFSYKLPAYAGGKGLGMQVELLTKQGQSLSWNNAFFSVSGAMSVLTINSFSIGLGGQYFLPSTGPTVHEGEIPTVVVGLTNSQKTSVAVATQVKVYNRVVTGNPLYDSTSPAFTIAAGANKTVTSVLPMFDKVPGVYAGTISFVDANGLAHSPVLEFRYIIGGDIATIQSVNTGAGTVTKGQVVNVSVLYSGSPYDTRTLDGVNVGTSTLSVALYNENNVLVGQASSSINIKDIVTKVVGVTALTDARALRADVVISKNGKTLSKLSTDFSPSLNTLPPAPTPAPVVDMTKIILAGLGVLIILIILVLLVFKKKKPTAPLPPSTPSSSPVSSTSSLPPTILPLLLIIAGSLLAFSNFSSVHVQASGTCTDLNGGTIAVPIGFTVDGLGNCVGNTTVVNAGNGPTITGPAGVFTDVTNEFDVTSPANALVRYGVSINGTDGAIPDYYLPSKTGAVRGASTTPVFMSFPTAGSRKFGVKTFVNNGSTWIPNSTYQDFPVNVVQSSISAGTFTGAGGWGLVSFWGTRSGATHQLLLSPNDITLENIQIINYTQAGLSTLHPGDSFNMQFRVQSLSCSNSNQQVILAMNPVIAGYSSPVPLITSVAGFKTPANTTVTNNSASCGGAPCNATTQTDISSGWMNLPANMAPGTYRVLFEMVDNPDNHYYGVVYGYKDITVIGKTTGSLDTANCDYITGWTCATDPNSNYSYATPTGVVLYKDDTFASTTAFSTTSIASGTRTDIAASCGNTNNHGFQIATPNEFKDGLQHNIYAYGLAANGVDKTLLVGAPISISCYLDVCNNIDGVQLTIPSDKISNGVGGCINNTTGDLCPNLDGPQSTVPVGDIIDAFGNCVPAGGVTDLCPNISGNQETIPTGYVIDAVRNCVPVSNVNLSCFATNVAGSKLDFANVGDLVVWTAFGVANPSQVNYVWSSPSLPSSPVSTATSSISVRYATIGNKTMTVSVGGGTPVQCGSGVVNTSNYLPVYSGQIFQPI